MSQSLLLRWQSRLGVELVLQVTVAVLTLFHELDMIKPEVRDRCGPRFACAQYFPVFFRNCSSLIRSADSKHFGAYYAFASTCARLPGTQMVKALQAAKCKGDPRRRAR